MKTKKEGELLHSAIKRGFLAGASKHELDFEELLGLNM
jgi:hypothetical protein